MNTNDTKSSLRWEWIFVIAIVAFVTFWVIPKYFIRAKVGGGTPTCFSLLWQIDEAKNQCALEEKLSSGDAVTDAEVARYIKHGMPECPQGGKYIVGKIGEPPRCDLPPHAHLHESLHRNDSVTAPSK
jgi:hypothetical protein